ncbi:hypothetical protein [Ekhidna sp.]|uniref:hypothetical protein n=1 Tax=Ekhidna sp. TaxID=2608089 RepID=UPI0032EBFE98
MNKKYAWGVFGTFWGIVGIGYAVYVEEFKKEKSLISYEVQSNTNTLDIKEEVGNLEIIYKGEDIQKKNLDLRVITLKIINNGDTDITENHFSKHVPFGFILEHGKIAEKPELINASNNFISNNLKISLDSLGRVVFTKLQIDQNHFFTVKILTINNRDSVPVIIPTGKISGVDSGFPLLIKENNSNESESFFNRLLQGSLMVHFTRYWLYSIVFVIIIWIILLPIFTFSDFMKKKKKERLSRKFIENTNNDYNDYTSLIHHFFLIEDASHVRYLLKILNNQDLVKSIIDLENNPNAIDEVLLSLDFNDLKKLTKNSNNKGDLVERFTNSSIYSNLKSLRALGIISTKHVEQGFLRYLREFVKYISIHYPEK